MKQKKLLITLSISLLAAGLHFFYIRALETKLRGGPAVSVLVAREKIKAGELPAKQLLATRTVPSICVDERTITADRSAEVTSLAASVAIAEGQTLLWTDFIERKTALTKDLAALVDSGQRAITIPVDGTLSMGGMLEPGHRVDILGTFKRLNKNKKEKATVTLLQNVPVLAIGGRLGTGAVPAVARRFSTVTLSVKIEEAELLSLAKTQGILSLVLRGHQDLAIVQDIPEKKMEDIWRADRRNALHQSSETPLARPGIERLKVR
jgi:pilus assembly protein CpaB